MGTFGLASTLRQIKSSRVPAGFPLGHGPLTQPQPIGDQHEADDHDVGLLDSSEQAAGVSRSYSAEG